MKKQNGFKMKDLISYMFSFFLTLLLIVVYLCVGFNIGVFDNKSLTKAIYESSYYQEVYDDLYQDTENLITDAGFPATVLTDAITLERVYIGSKNYVERALRGEEPDIKTDKLKSALSDNINAYLEEENIIRSNKLDSSIADLILVVEHKYKDAIQLKLAGDIAAYRQKYENIIMILLPIIIVLVGVLCTLLVRMHRYRHKGVRFIVYALMTSSLMTILAAFVLIQTGQYARIDVNPDYYKKLVTSYLQWDMMIFVYMGGIGLTLAVALATYVRYLKSRIAFQ